MGYAIITAPRTTSMASISIFLVVTTPLGDLLFGRDVRGVVQRLAKHRRHLRHGGVAVPLAVRVLTERGAALGREHTIRLGLKVLVQALLVRVTRGAVLRELVALHLQALDAQPEVVDLDELANDGRDGRLRRRLVQELVVVALAFAVNEHHRAVVASSTRASLVARADLIEGARFRPRLTAASRRSGKATFRFSRETEPDLVFLARNGSRSPDICHG